MLLNFNAHNQFNHYSNQPDINWNQASPRFNFPQKETTASNVCQVNKKDTVELEKISKQIDEDPIDESSDDFNANENDDEYLYLTINLSTQAVNKLKNLPPEQIIQIRQLGILGFQFESENTTFKLDNMGNNYNLNDESHNKKRPRKTVMELTVNNGANHESEPRSKKSKIRDSDHDSSNCSENMSDELKNIYQIRQMLSQQAQKEEDIGEPVEKPKKSRQRAPHDPNKPKAKRSSKAKIEQNHDLQIPVQPPVRINQLIQQNAFINQNLQSQFNQHHYTNNQEQMKIRNILFYNNSSQGVQEATQNGFIDNQQKVSQNANFLILNSNLNSNSDCNSNSNMTTNSDMSLTNNNYSMNNNQINFLNI